MHKSISSENCLTIETTNKNSEYKPWHHIPTTNFKNQQDRTSPELDSVKNIHLGKLITRINPNEERFY